MSVSLGDLWSGAAGAALVALFTIGYTEVREARQRLRARMGYARILDAEIEANGRALEQVHEDTVMSWEDFTSTWLERPPTDEVWREIRAPLAPLIRAEDFDILDEHYRLLGVLLDMKEHPSVSREPKDWGVYGVSSDLKDEVPRLRNMLSRYANPPPERPITLAERLTRLVEIKHEEDRQRAGLPDDFDWDETYARVRQMILERGGNPDVLYEDYIQGG